jgi:hypothetical protein
VRRIFLAAAPALAAAAVLVPLAWAGSPHFVDSTVNAARAGDSLVVSGKEAGLGDEAQVHIVLTATAACINPGGNQPQAANKETFSTGGDFPVQNGKADFSLTLTATFQPSCSPPMSVQWTDVTVTDTTNSVTASFAGPF